MKKNVLFLFQRPNFWFISEFFRRFNVVKLTTLINDILGLYTVNKHTAGQYA